MQELILKCLYWNAKDTENNLEEERSWRPSLTKHWDCYKATVIKAVSDWCKHQNGRGSPEADLCMCLYGHVTEDQGPTVYTSIHSMISFIKIARTGDTILGDSSRSSVLGTGWLKMGTKYPSACWKPSSSPLDYSCTGLSVPKNSETICLRFVYWLCALY